MNKQNMIDEITQRTKLEKSKVEEITNEVFLFIRRSVSKDEPVRIRDFGTFEPRLCQARKYRNPATGKVMTVPQQIRPKFSATGEFKHLFKA